MFKLTASSLANRSSRSWIYHSEVDYTDEKKKVAEPHKDVGRCPAAGGRSYPTSCPHSVRVHDFDYKAAITTPS